MENNNSQRDNSLSFNDIKEQKNLIEITKPIVNELKALAASISQERKDYESLMIQRDASLNNDLKQIMNHKIKIDKNDVETILSLKNELKSFSDNVNDFKNIDIPKKVEVSQELKITSDTWTKRFYIISPLIAGVFFVLGVFCWYNTIQKYNEIEPFTKTRPAYIKAHKEGRTFIYDILPTSSKEYLDKNYPNWRTHQ